LVKAVMAMYEGAQTVVRTTEGDSKAFNVKVGLHQGSVFEFPTVCDSNGNDFQRATSRFASRITVCIKTDRQGIRYLCEELSDAWQ